MAEFNDGENAVVKKSEATPYALINYPLVEKVQNRSACV